MSLCAITMKGLGDTIRRLDYAQGKGMRKAEHDTLREVVRTAHGYAVGNLSGPGRREVRLRESRRFKHQDGNISRRTLRKTRASGQSSGMGARPGSYPVPTCTGHLRRSEGFVDPGRSVSSNGKNFSAGPHEVILFNSARYARVIHSPRRGESSYRYGDRAFMVDALRKTGVVEIAGKHYKDVFDG